MLTDAPAAAGTAHDSAHVRTGIAGVARHWLTLGGVFRRMSLLTKFGLIALLAVASIGVVVGHTLRDAIEQQAVRASIAQAQTASRLGLQNVISPAEIERGLSPARVRAVQLTLQALYARTDVVDIVLWNPDRTVVFATDPAKIGTISSPSSALTSASAGQAVARLVDVSSADLVLRRHGQLLRVYQPITFGSVADGGTAAGIMRTSMPYRPISDAIAAETRQLYAVLFVAFVTLYALLFRLVANASTELRRRAEESEHQARHDRLTGLPNRVCFLEQLGLRLEDSSSADVGIAVLLIDLDRFKEINDTLGHYHGDLLLTEVGRRLREAVRPTDAVARLGGDEFVIMLEAVDNVAAAISVARKIRRAIKRPYTVEGLRLEIDASLGIALAPAHGRHPATLLRRADVAMYDAKHTQAGPAVYDPASDIHSRRRLALTGELRRGIDAGELVLHYQPKIDLSSGRPVGVEALVRWAHPQHGLLGPHEFIPLAERSELINDVTAAVLDQALAQVRRWADQGLDLHVAVNVSPRNLHDIGLPSAVQELLRHHGVEPRHLILEVTETTIMAEPERAVMVLRALDDAGVGLSIDDFGTGYSALAVLRSLPVCELKIDRRFVRDLIADGGDPAIVHFSTQLGHALGLTVVAEGVEDADACVQLLELGCDAAQGYWFAKPMAAAELNRWLTKVAPLQSVAQSQASTPTQPAAPASHDSEDKRARRPHAGRPGGDVSPRGPVAADETR